MKIAIVTPESSGARSGNQHTATRWARHLRHLGHRVTIAGRWNEKATDLLIALHARKSHESIASFARNQPASPLLVVLTGTDLYRDIKSDRDAQRSLQLASRLIVLQPEGSRKLSPELRAKARVIFQSADVSLPQRPLTRRFRLAVVGHLRPEKDPFRAADAMARLARHPDLELIHLGKALTPAMAREARHWMARETRYRWLGSKSHSQTLRWLASSHLLIVSSIMEGGANVICEAARIGVPVLASRVAGNIGMLGRDYPGYFALHDGAGLAKLIERAKIDPKFYHTLKRATRSRRALFAPAAERTALRDVIRELKAS